MEKTHSGPDGKYDLERVLNYGIYGEPVVKKGERMHFLGQLRERLLFSLSRKMTGRGKIPPQLEKALADIRASRLILNGNSKLENLLKYERLAAKHGVKATTVSNPEFEGDVGLVVASNHAVDLPDSVVFSPWKG